jgi:tetratricopeptide (TPR) repeat protein
MKKLFFALAIVCSLQAAYAQKPDADMQKAVDKALSAAQDAKKATKAATWINLGKAYWTAYQNPLSNVTPGIDKNTFGMMFKERPQATQQVELEGRPYEKVVYSHINAYFNAAGILTIAEVTHPSVQGDLLGEAAKAYSKAFELGAKEKDVDPRLQEIAEALYNDGFSAYQLGDLKKASDLFKGAADASALPGCTVRNDDAAYNAAFTALQVKDYARAEEYYNKCLANDYTSEGNIYASLSEIALAKADTLSAKNYLATGLTAYPDNASILTNLINLYLATKEDPSKIVELLDEAKKAMPDNPSLYYVEGNIYTGIKDYEKAIAAYDKGIEINPNYDMTYYGKANVALKQADDLIDEREALDVREYKKYDELTAKVVEIYKGAIEPFEKCYEVSQIPEVKAAAADFLKRLNFQLRNEDPKFQAAYEKWNGIVTAE